MKNVILKVENISKQYRLGTVGTGSLSHDFNRFWHRIRGKEDPYLKIGAVNDRSKAATGAYAWALKDINFEVAKGEVLGIIGKNGAGKSTLLKILSRVTSPTTGEIKTKGRIASLLEVGTGFHPELTGRENIYLNGAILGMTKSEIASKIDEIIEFSGCQMYIDTPTKRYSSGMTVRLAFAVAAHLEPDILIVDEVLAVGDAEFQKKAIGKMQDISSGEGRTVIFVSHNMASVKSLCTRGIVLENGYVKYIGTQNDAVEYYLSQQNTLNKINVSERTDRVGNQKLTVNKVLFFNSNEVEISDVISGEFLKIRVYIKKNLDVDFAKLFVAINFVDNEANFGLSYINDEMGYTFENLENKDFFELIIPNIYLRSAVYGIRILISEKDTREENFIDVIDNAALINILEGDIWNTGKLNRPGNSAILPGKFL